jgi:hypothetical protein
MQPVGRRTRQVRKVVVYRPAATCRYEAVKKKTIHIVLM